MIDPTEGTETRLLYVPHIERFGFIMIDPTEGTETSNWPLQLTRIGALHHDGPDGGYGNSFWQGVMDVFEALHLDGPDGGYGNTFGAWTGSALKAASSGLTRLRVLKLKQRGNVQPRRVGFIMIDPTEGTETLGLFHQPQVV